MKKIFTNRDLIAISIDIRELMMEDITFSLKFELLQFLDAVLPTIANFEKVKDSIFKKYGENREDGSIVVKQFTDEQSPEKGLTEEFKQFSKDLMDLQAIEVEIEYEPIPLSLFGNLSSKGKANLMRIIKK